MISRAGHWSRLGNGSLHFPDETNVPALLIIRTLVPRLRSLFPTNIRMQVHSAGATFATPKQDATEGSYVDLSVHEL